MGNLRGPIGWWPTRSLYLLAKFVKLCSGTFSVPAITSEAPVTVQAEVQLLFERRDSVVSTCGGSTGYYACAFSLGGGCCQQGLVCASNGLCIATSTATTTSVDLVCDSDYNQCAISLGGKNQDIELNNSVKPIC